MPAHDIAHTSESLPAMPDFPHHTLARTAAASTPTHNISFLTWRRRCSFVLIATPCRMTKHGVNRARRHATRSIAGVPDVAGMLIAGWWFASASDIGGEFVIGLIVGVGVLAMRHTLHKSK